MRINPKDGAGPKVDDSAIARLEREVAEERENSARLLSEVRELKFKSEILERSYAKQLQDARLRAESAEKALNDQRTRNAELDALRNDAIELLSDTQAEIDRLTKERNQLHRQLTSRDGYQVEGAEDEAGENDGGGTINTLLNDAGWLKRKKPGEEAKARAEAEAAARAAEEAAAGNMLDPDTYISAKGKHD
jgi:DNA repair exonuclease SbcCD ATPase subunit